MFVHLITQLKYPHASSEFYRPKEIIKNTVGLYNLVYLGGEL